MNPAIYPNGFAHPKWND